MTTTTIERVQAALTEGDEVEIRGYRGAFGGIVQYFTLCGLGLSRAEVMDAEVQAVLASAYAGPCRLLNTENDQTAAYWRAVNP